MEKYSRSKSSREGVKAQPSSMHDLRSYSTTSDHNNNLDYNKSFNKESANKTTMKKSRIISASSSSSSSSSKNWNLNMDQPELQRKKRVAGYKAYGVEGKMKSSFRTSFKWIKDTCNHVAHGLW
ncbi:hypothetical protein ACP275_04G096300 [Erythranthe tilingii]